MTGPVRFGNPPARSAVHESAPAVRVAVVGGGLAGIAAAVRLADAGRQVLLYEAGARLGGLTHSFRRGELDVDNGQHVFLRCCTAYLDLLGRLGVRGQVHLQPRLDVVVRAPGRTARLRRTGLPAPLHLAGTLLRYPMLSPADRARAVAGALALRRIRLADPAVDEVNFAGWLARHGQNARTTAALWDVFTIAALNVPAAEASLAMAAKVFQTGLLTRAGAGDIGWSRLPLQQLHAEPAARALAAAGAELRTRTRVAGLRPDSGGWLLTDQAGGTDRADQVVLAAPPDQVERLLPAGALDQPAGWSAGLGTSPIVNAHLVLDRQVLTEPFVAGLDSAVQWVFDRTEQSGLARLPGRAGQQYLAISLSAADELIDLRTAELRDRILPALTALLPELRGARVLDFFVTRERHATFRPAPGTGRLRPGTATRLPGLVLAGAWTDTGWPATMESAVLSGEAAAALLLATPAPAAAVPAVPAGQAGRVDPAPGTGKIPGPERADSQHQRNPDSTSHDAPPAGTAPTAGTAPQRPELERNAT